MVLGVFEYPRVTTLVVQQAWVVVSLVEVFEDGGKDFRLSVISKVRVNTMSLSQQPILIG